MNEINEKLFNLTTYGFTFAGIVTNFETLKSLVLFVLGFIFLVLQIIYQIQKIRGIRK